MTDHFKNHIYKQTCELYREWYGEDHGRKGSCLYWSVTAGHILMRYGIRAVPQAGTLHWPIWPDAPAPHPTHLTYQWSPEHPKSAAAIAAGEMPEMHCWLGLVDDQEIIDFSVRYLPQAAARHGLSWFGPLPPQFLWTKIKDLPAGVIYHPEMEATKYFIALRLKDLLNEQSNHSEGLDIRVRE